MTKPFKGKINVDIRDSAPDWSPFEPPKAPDGAPSVEAWAEALPGPGEHRVRLGG